MSAETLHKWIRQVKVDEGKATHDSADLPVYR
jgi:hypothetical protein